MAIEPDVMVQRLLASFADLDEATALQYVEDAVGQLSLDVPIVTSTTLAIVSGVASYDLPADFLFVVELPGLATSDNVLLSDGGLVPLSSAFSEQFYIEGDQVRFDPVPSFTLSRSMRYAARHVLAAGVYPRLSENGARIALLYARFLALQRKAVEAAGGFSYRIGDEAVDKSRVGASMQQQEDAALAAYLAAVRQLRGFAGSTNRAQFTGVI